MEKTPKKTAAVTPSNGVASAQRRAARAELVWDGKYDAAGRRVAPLRVALPFQTVETVNESAQDRQRSLQFGPGFREEQWRNRLIWGDKKYVLSSLLSEFAGKVNLIYIDPPFDTGADFSFTAIVPDNPNRPNDESFTFTKEPSIIEHKAYRDTWGRGVESYLQWFYESAILLHELLHETGSIYIHVEPDIGNLVRVVLDEVFGPQSRRTEICWKRTSSHEAKHSVRFGSRSSSAQSRTIGFGISNTSHLTMPTSKVTLPGAIRTVVVGRHLIWSTPECDRTLHTNTKVINLTRTVGRFHARRWKSMIGREGFISPRSPMGVSD